MKLLTKLSFVERVDLVIVNYVTLGLRVGSAYTLNVNVKRGI